MSGNNPENSFIPETNSLRSRPDDDSYNPQSIRETRSGGSLFVWFSLGLLVVAMLVSAGLFIYKQSVKSNLAGKQNQLKQARSGFDAALIDELDSLAARIDTTKELLNQHVAFTAIFPIIERATLTSVTFNSMKVEYDRSEDSKSEDSSADADSASADQPQDAGQTDAQSNQEPERTTGADLLSQSQASGDGGSVTVNLSGVGPGFPTVALQSSELADNDRINNPVLSDFSPNENGNVEFSVQFTIPESEILYQNTSMSSL
jgi:hypothetical protein